MYLFVPVYSIVILSIKPSYDQASRLGQRSPVAKQPLGIAAIWLGYFEILGLSEYVPFGRCWIVIGDISLYLIINLAELCEWIVTK